MIFLFILALATRSNDRKNLKIRVTVSDGGTDFLRQTECNFWCRPESAKLILTDLARRVTCQPQPANGAFTLSPATRKWKHRLTKRDVQPVAETLARR